MSLKKVAVVVYKLKVIGHFGNGSYSYSSFTRPSSVDKYLRVTNPTTGRPSEISTFKNEWVNYIIKKDEVKRTQSFRINYDFQTKTPINVTKKITKIDKWFSNDGKTKMYTSKQHKDRWRRGSLQSKISKPNVRASKSAQNFPLYTWKMNPWIGKAGKKMENMPAVRETFHKRSLYDKIIRQSLFKKTSKNKVKYSRTEKEVLWPTLYRYKGPQMGKKITQPEYKNEEKPVLRSMTSPNKTYFSKISANLNNANTETELSFKKYQTKKTTMPKKRLGYTQTTIQWLVDKRESMYQPLYPYKGNVGQVSQFERTSENVQKMTKMETTKDVANTNKKEAEITLTDYPKNNTLNDTKTCEELKNSLSCQKKTSDLKSNETTKIEQFPSIIEQNQNLSNLKNGMKITRSDVVKNNIIADQNFANKVLISSEISKNLTTNSELAVQNINRTRNQLITTNTIGADVQRAGTSNRPNMNNTRPPCHVLTKISWSKRQQQRQIFTSTKVHNRIKSRPLFNYNSVNDYSTFSKLSQKESKVLNYLLKMIKMNGEPKQAYFPYFGKLYAKNRVLPPSLHKEKTSKWLSIEDIAKLYPINVKSKSVLTKEIEEIKPEEPVTKFSDNTSTINNGLNTEKHINEQPKANPVKRNKNPAKIRLIVDGPIIWRCEKALSKRHQRVKSNFQHKKEILRSGRGTNKQKLGNLVFSKQTTCRYEPLYFCKHKVTLEKLNADYLQNKAKRITNNVQRSKSDYSLCNSMPNNKFENSSTKSLKDIPVLVRVNYMSTSQNKQYFNSCANSAINLDSHNEVNEEELPQKLRKNRTTIASDHHLRSKSKINRTKPMYSEFVLRKNKSIDNFPYFSNKSTQTAKPNSDNLLVEKGPNVFPKNENNLLKSVLDNIVAKQKNYGRMLCPMKPPRIFYKKPLMAVMPVTTSGFALPVNINLKHDQEIRKFPSFEKSQKLNTNHRDSAFGTVINSCKQSKSPVNQDKTFKSIMSLGTGDPQKIKIHPKPVAISLKTSKPSLMRNSNSSKKLGTLIKRNPFFIDENDSVCDNTNNQSSRSGTKEADFQETGNNFGDLFSESQKKNKAILTKSLLNPNNMDYSTSMTSKVKTETLDDSLITEEEFNQPSQVDLLNQSMVFDSNSSKQQTSLNSDFNEKNLNKKTFPVGTLNIFTKPVPVVVTDYDISGECSKNDAAQQIDILEKTIPQDQVVNPTKNLSLETQPYEKEENTFYVVDNQDKNCPSSHQHQKQFKPKNYYIPFTPIGFIKTDTSNNKNCEEPNNKKNIINQDLTQLIEQENRIEFLPCEKSVKENHENTSDLKHLAQEYYISQNNQEESQFLETEVCSNESNSVGINTDPISEEEYNLDEPLELGIDENNDNEQSMKILYNITSAENNFPPNNNDNNNEKILSSKTSDSVKNGPVTKERFRVNIGTQTISKLLPVNTNLRLPKITLNCEKSWYTEHLSSEKKLLFLQLLK